MKSTAACFEDTETQKMRTFTIEVPNYHVRIAHFLCYMVIRPPLRRVAEKAVFLCFLHHLEGWQQIGGCNR